MLIRRLNTLEDALPLEGFSFMVVYKITNTVTGTVYFGSTHSFGYRILIHKEDLHNKKHHNYKLQKDYNKYGKDAFKYEIIKHFSTKDDAEKYEYKLINKHENIYNIQKESYAFPDLEGKTRMTTSKNGCTIVSKKFTPYKKIKKKKKKSNGKSIAEKQKERGLKFKRNGNEI